MKLTKEDRARIRHAPLLEYEEGWQDVVALLDDLDEAEREIGRLRGILREFTDSDDFVYGPGHTERSNKAREAVKP